MTRVAPFAATPAAVLATCGFLLAAPAAGQARFHDLDSGRPATTEDALAIARHQLDLRFGGIGVERIHSGSYDLGVEPEMVYGSWRGGQITVGVPVLLNDQGERGPLATGVDVSLLQNITLETGGIPALGFSAGVEIPLQEDASSGSFPWVKAIATRTFSFGRVHLNGRYTFGSLDHEPTSGGAWATTAAGATRWLAGLGVDRTLPLESLLLVGEVYGIRPASEGDVLWNAAAGLRYQPSPDLVLDGAVGRAVRDGPAWSMVLGLTYSWAIRSLMPTWFR